MDADDTCIAAPSPSAMYKLLEICTDFATNNSIVFNHTKSKYLWFKPESLLNLHVHNVNFIGEVLPGVTCTRYLGVVIDSPAQANGDILHHVRAIYTRGNDDEYI